MQCSCAPSKTTCATTPTSSGYGSTTGACRSERSPAEKVDFNHMLGNVNWLYLGCSVLILLDLSYFSRFWTQFEAWLAMQACSSKGLRSEAASEGTGNSKRCVVVPIYGATKGMSQELRETRANKTPKEAHNILGKPDVMVTNQNDKNKQLRKITELDEEVRNAWKKEVMQTQNQGEPQV